MVNNDSETFIKSITPIDDKTIEDKKKIDVNKPIYIPSPIYSSIGYTFSWALLFALIILFHNNIFGVDLSSPHIAILIYVMCAGGIGGVLYGLNNIIILVEKGEFELNNLLGYILRPIMAPIVGLVSFLIIAGGLMNLVGANMNTDYSNYSTILSYCAIAVVAGFATDQFLFKLRDLAITLFSSNKST